MLKAVLSTLRAEGNNIMIIEISKCYLKEFYNNDIAEILKQKDGIFWTDARIKGAFNCGNGTESDLKKYMENNKKYCIFIEI